MTPILLLAAVLGVLYNPSPAHASPYGPFCDPYSRAYNSKVCASDPRVDEECSEFANEQACQDDYQIQQRWSHELSPTPN